jgi:cytochrome c oxidase assembly factor CtaG
VEWSFEPGVIAWLAVAEGLYVRALRVLGRRGVRIPLAQRLAWHGAMALWAIGLLTPVDGLGEELLSAHMAQHLLIADLAAPLLVAGLRTPMLAFYWPRSVLVAFARRRRLRAAFAMLRRPLVALPVYALVLYGWHVGFLFEAAVSSPVVHAAQHASFIGAGVLVWWSALEPQRRRLRGELWKIGHIIGARFLGMFLGMGFVIVRTPVYAGVYGTGDRGHGLDALADQQLAGGMMVVLDILIMVGALAFFFARAAQDDDRRVAAEAEAAAAAGPAAAAGAAGAAGAVSRVPPGHDDIAPVPRGRREVAPVPPGHDAGDAEARPATRR